jgi:hypothetical protein
MTKIAVCPKCGENIDITESDQEYVINRFQVILETELKYVRESIVRLERVIRASRETQVVNAKDPIKIKDREDKPRNIKAWGEEANKKF